MTLTKDKQEPTAHRGSREVATLVSLWLVAAVLAARQVVVTLGGSYERRLTDVTYWLARNGTLSSPESVYDGGSFSATPFAAALLRPLSMLDRRLFEVLWTVGLLALCVALAVAVVRHLPRVERAPGWVLPLVLSVLLLCVPVRSMFSTGAAGAFPVLLALVAFVYGGRATWRELSPVVPLSGLLIGVAAALQPVLLLFAPLLWLLGRRREASGAIGAFLAASLVAWAALPAASAQYWLSHFGGVGLGGDPAEVGNQSLHGLLLRLGLSGPGEIVLFLTLAAAVTVIGVTRAVRYARDGQVLLAAAIVGCVVVAVSPVAWPYQQLWIMLAAVGRLGRRRGDRLVWPVLVLLVMSLSAEALVPKIAWFAPFAENAPLLVALAAALALPFVSRTSPQWDDPEPSGPFSRPHLMLELLLIRVGYFAYSYVRSLAPDSRAIAEGHGRQILELEQALRLDMELWINQIVARTPWLEQSMNFYYGAFHFLVPVSVLAWLYLCRPSTYRWARNSLCFATLLGLVGFLCYPLAPPRLMPGYDYVDTINGPQDFDDPSFGVLTGVSNQYAAMPSLHVGWSLWAGLVLIRISPWLWVRLLGAVYPLLTTVVVMGTANHYLLDAAGGAIVVAAGFGLAGLWARFGAGSPRPVDRSTETEEPGDASGRPQPVTDTEAGEETTVPTPRQGAPGVPTPPLTAAPAFPRGSGPRERESERDGDGSEPAPA